MTNDYVNIGTHAKSVRNVTPRVRGSVSGRSVAYCMARGYTNMRRVCQHLIIRYCSVVSMLLRDAAHSMALKLSCSRAVCAWFRGITCAHLTGSALLRSLQFSFGLVPKPAKVSACAARISGTHSVASFPAIELRARRTGIY